MWPGQKAKAGSRTPPSKVVPFPHRRRPEQPPWDIRIVSGLGHTGRTSAMRSPGLCLWHRQQSLPLSRQGRPQGLSPCDAPHNPITSLGCYLATPLRCPRPDGPLGEPWTLSAPRLQGRGWALPSQDITVSGSPPCSQERSRGLFERGVPGRGWMREDPGGGQSPGPSRAGGRGASHQPFPGVSVGHVTPGVTPLAAAQAVGHD